MHLSECCFETNWSECLNGLKNTWSMLGAPDLNHTSRYRISVNKLMCTSDKKRCSAMVLWADGKKNKLQFYIWHRRGCNLSWFFPIQPCWSTHCHRCNCPSVSKIPTYPGIFRTWFKQPTSHDTTSAWLYLVVVGFPNRFASVYSVMCWPTCHE